MSNNTVVSFRQPDEIDDLLTAVLRSGARRLLAQAIEAEAEAFLAEMRGERLADERERVVRHGHGVTFHSWLQCYAKVGFSAPGTGLARGGSGSPPALHCSSL